MTLWNSGGPVFRELASGTGSTVVELEVLDGACTHAGRRLVALQIRRLRDVRVGDAFERVLVASAGRELSRHRDENATRPKKSSANLAFWVVLQIVSSPAPGPI